MTSLEFPEVHIDYRYGITAMHVANDTTSQDKSKPGNIDICSSGVLDLFALMNRGLDNDNATSSQARKKRTVQDLQDLLERYNENVGREVKGRHGVDGEGWREDWSLIKVEDKWATFTTNDRWWWAEGIRHLLPDLGLSSTLKLEVNGNRDAKHLEKVFKDGCRTEVTEGMVDVNGTLVYYRPRSESADP
jgi:hypothetical protein